MSSTSLEQPRQQGGPTGRRLPSSLRTATPRPARRRSRGRAGIALVSPAVALAVVFILIPLAFAVYISLTDWPLVGNYHFVGVRNYSAMTHDSVFLHSVLFTAAYTAIVTPAALVTGYVLALLVRRPRPLSTFFRTVFFIPFVVGLATESYVVLLDLQPDSGAINAVLAKLHLVSISTAWTIHPHLALVGVCTMVTWYASGLTMLMLMAGMQGIPAELYESAHVDGASWWQRERLITVPLLRRTIALVLIISVVGSFLAFNQFFILTQGGPGTSTETVVMWIYQVAFVQLRVGYATAMSMVLVVVIAVISAVQFFLLREKDE